MAPEVVEGRIQADTTLVPGAERGKKVADQQLTRTSGRCVDIGGIADTAEAALRRGCGAAAVTQWLTQ